MQKIPAKFILTRKPKEYLKQGLSHCGVYSVKAILSAYRKDDKGHSKEYQTNWVCRNLFSFAIGEKYYDKIFASYGLKTQTKSANHLSNQERIELLKTLPIGNTTRTYNEILRDWNFGRWQPWTWNNSSKNYLYVEIMHTY